MRRAMCLGSLSAKDMPESFGDQFPLEKPKAEPDAFDEALFEPPMVKQEK